MNRRLSRTIAIAGICASTLAVGATAQAANLPDQTVDQFVAEHPNATKISDSSVSFDNGTVIMEWRPRAAGKTSTSSTAATAQGFTTQATVNGCESGWACFYEDQNFGGRMVRFRDTQILQDFRQYGFNDATSSWVNNRGSGGSVYDTAYGGTLLWSMSANSKVSFVGTGANDRASSFKLYD